MKYILPAVVILALATGCTRGPKGLPVLKMPQRGTQQATVDTQTQGAIQSSTEYASTQPATATVSSNNKQHKRVVYTSKKSKKHGLKPEPYSIGSGEKDPELLGPQTTINRNAKPSQKNKVVMPVMQEKDLVKSSKKIKSGKKIASVKKVSTSKKKISQKKPATVASKTVTKKESMPSIDKVIKKSSTTVTKKIEEKQPIQQVSKEADKAPAQKTQSAMTKAECLTMIGESKFTDYVSRFGGESGAIKRCEILKKLRG